MKVVSYVKGAKIEKTKIEDVYSTQLKFYSTMPCTPFCRPLFGKSHLTINQVLIKM